MMRHDNEIQAYARLRVCGDVWQLQCFDLLADTILCALYSM